MRGFNCMQYIREAYNDAGNRTFKALTPSSSAAASGLLSDRSSRRGAKRLAVLANLMHSSAYSLAPAAFSDNAATALLHSVTASAIVILGAALRAGMIVNAAAETDISRLRARATAEAVVVPLLET